MRKLHYALGIFALTALAAGAADAPPEAETEVFKAEEVVTPITWSGMDYQAVAGTLVVHPQGWDDVKDKENKDNPTAVASMFFVAYLKKGVPAAQRPLAFLYNGGPGAASVFLHMGAFGPQRVVTANPGQTPAAPYRLIENDCSLLDVSDAVFVDAPGTGFSRVAGKDKEKSFYGVDADAHAYEQFIVQFLSKYKRWNSPKYLVGESYGTPRSAVLINKLQAEAGIDFNGVVLISQILNLGLNADGPEADPGGDLPYVLALPTYAATAWYHHKLPDQPQPALEELLREVRRFAMTDYLLALSQGLALPPDARQAVAAKLHAYTGLPTAYILKADLRISGGEFEKNLQDEEGLTVGRTDARYSGPSLDPLSKEADYDPLDAGIDSAYISVFADYVRNVLHYGEDKEYRALTDINSRWDFKHGNPIGEDMGFHTTLNTLPDLATALKYNPSLKVMTLGGYFDLATPFAEGIYEMEHLQIPLELRKNISAHYYPSGHLIYANPAALKQMHADVAEFIRATDNLPGQ